MSPRPALLAALLLPLLLLLQEPPAAEGRLVDGIPWGLIPRRFQPLFQGPGAQGPGKGLGKGQGQRFGKGPSQGLGKGLAKDWKKGQETQDKAGSRSGGGSNDEHESYFLSVSEMQAAYERWRQMMGFGLSFSRRG